MDNNNFWEVIREENVERGSQMPDPQKETTKFEAITSWICKIIGWVVLGVFLLCLLFFILVHPADRLKLCIFLSGGNFTIDVSAQFSYYDGSYGVNRNQTISKIKVDGNLICVTGGSNRETYYEVDGETIYVYKQNENGEWTRTTATGQIPIVGTSSGNDATLSVFMDRKNYERGELFRYRIKDGVNIGVYDEAHIQQWGTKYEIKASQKIYQGDVLVTMSFGRFGITKLTLPWEE